MQPQRLHNDSVHQLVERQPLARQRNILVAERPLRLRPAPRRSQILPQHLAEVAGPHFLVVKHKRHPLQHIAQFAHIARPGVVGHQPGRTVAEATKLFPPGPGKLGDHTLGQRQNILAPLAQRRNRDPPHIQPIIQILAEPAPLHFARQIQIGRANQPQIHRNLAQAADPEKLPLLQHPQQLPLHLQRHVANLIQKQRAAVAQVHLALLPLGQRAGKRPRLVAEQLGFKQMRLQRRTVQVDKRRRRRLLAIVNDPGDDLLADAGLAFDQHRNRAVGMVTQRLLVDFAHRRRSKHQPRQPQPVAQQPAQPLQLAIGLRRRLADLLGHLLV